MSFFLALLMSWCAYADLLTVDEKRLEDFSSYVLNKSAKDEERQSQAKDVKVHRLQREETYDLQRENFVRKENTMPQGADVYERYVAERVKSYEDLREKYAVTQQQASERLHDKLDKVKMIEYGL